MTVGSVPHNARFHNDNAHLYCNRCGGPMHSSMIGDILDEVVKSIADVRAAMVNTSDLQASSKGVENQRGKEDDMFSNNMIARYGDLEPIYDKAIKEVREGLKSYPITGGVDLRPDGKHIMESIYHSQMGQPALSSKAVNNFIRESNIKGATKNNHHGLSQTSNMWGASEDLPTAACPVGKTLRNVEGSTCRHCYVDKSGSKMRGNSAQQHYWRNLLGLANPHQYAAALSYQIAQHPDKRFRFNSSGDTQNAHHFAIKMDVARANPDTQFWLATREAHQLEEYLKAHPPETREEAIPPNVTVRLSTTMQKQHPKEDSRIHRLTQMHPRITSTSVNASHLGKDKVYVCPAAGKSGTENTCEHWNCDACWDPSIPWIDYTGHGDKEIRPDHTREEMEAVIQAMDNSEKIRLSRQNPTPGPTIPEQFRFRQ